MKIGSAVQPLLRPHTGTTSASVVSPRLLHTVGMSMESLPKFPVPVKGKTEWKIKAAALGTYLAALAGSIVLSTTVTDYVHALPDWAETIVYPAVVAGVTLLSGRAASSKPGYLSPSTIEAVEIWLRRNLPRR